LGRGIFGYSDGKYGSLKKDDFLGGGKFSREKCQVENGRTMINFEYAV
jgi:hypothetical protein